MRVPKGLARVVVRRKNGRLQTLEETVEEQEKLGKLSGSSVKDDIEATLKDPTALQEATEAFLLQNKDLKVVMLGVGETTNEVLAQHVKDGTPLGLRLVENYRRLLEYVLRVIGEW